MTNKEFKKLKDDLWLAANKLRADSDLKSNDYATPVLGWHNSFNNKESA